MINFKYSKIGAMHTLTTQQGYISFRRDLNEWSGRNQYLMLDDLLKERDNITIADMNIGRTEESFFVDVENFYTVIKE